MANIQIGDDTLVFLQALKDLGFQVQHSGGDVCTIIGSGGRIPAKSASIWCGSAGTAARFLLPVAAAGIGRYHFDSTEQMRRRPMTPLIQALLSQGADICFHNRHIPY